jgi:hypothetical protein
MGENAVPGPLDVSAVRARRANLRKASARVEDVLSRAEPSAGTAWAEELTLVMAELTRAWETHVALTESPNGLLEQITTDAPRLSSTVARLRREHVDVATRLRSVDEQLRSGQEPGLSQTRSDLATALVKINHHRKEGGELIHQAYQIDIGGE